ncbi:uncharacterized protein BO66DRAFT_447114 [Aspergillus aculeatinus CBS 121060]|uniref:Uncharacterized protein n=1 Tax=Aspergillus aculeatinus CBS 121060 TaxID=1448322 RepID=A0ACD1HFM1_9EURO|nr:hypothetical protein BO66DRAFT_447114 [Aspergillus aculeatinus CBS 121060]RAH72394.1 hypothetical protein BO66DRAFT_447114 [Aspergillus aculeatinus CBS 121060]
MMLHDPAPANSPLPTSSQGEDPVDGIIYEYKCSAYAKKDYLLKTTASSALDCARQCAAQATTTGSQSCHAANWGPLNSECHLYGSGFQQKADTSGDWILLVRTDRAAQDCQSLIDQAVGTEKMDCQTKLNDKDLEKTTAVNTEKSACTKQVNNEKSACTKQSNDRKKYDYTKKKFTKGNWLLNPSSGELTARVG